MAGLTPQPDGSYLVMGQRVAMPVLVRKAKQAAVMFLVDHNAAQRMVAPTGLKVVRQLGGKAIVTLALVDYIDNDLGTYTELGLVFMVHDSGATPTSANYGNRKAVTTYIHRLPVNGEFTKEAGYGIWGFPKWVADLSVDFDRNGVTAQLKSGDEVVMTVRAKRGPIRVPRRAMPMNAYTCDEDGIVRRTPWTTDGTQKQQVRLGGATVEVGYGHPLADELRALGFPKRCLATIFDDDMQATFGAPEIVSA
ncbi:MAG TPA: acetoacetate decarboxylase family protein [Microthrixaceae bacterium]|nr:acetoacetate decarboxylase family protein [Microthrixaceae bacterium]HPB45027.1 acetoacetate decarboxylase family protein [Microthrixaceae bacterium]